jgi:RNA polymerase sigma-B factor
MGCFLSLNNCPNPHDAIHSHNGCAIGTLRYRGKDSWKWGKTALVGSSRQVPTKVSRDRLIASHLPLVRSIARRHLGRGEDLDDLLQVGAVGLVKASDRFDASRGVAFGTFAAPTIEGEIRRHLRDRTGPIRLPREMEEIRRALRVHREELASTLGRRPTVKELAESLSADERDIERALATEDDQSSVSISTEVETTELPDDVEALASSDDRMLLAASMRTLDERERRIVFLRFHADMTERQIADELDTSQATVSRILTRALAKLREELASAGVNSTDRDISAGTVKRTSSAQTTTPDASAATLARYLELPYQLDVRSGRDGERTRWTASVEELPGCTSRGDTAEEALAGLRAAMESWLTAAIAENREIPQPGQDAAKSRASHSYSGRFLVRMPKSLHEELAQAAEKEQISLNRLVTDVLASAVEQGDLARTNGAKSDRGAVDRSAEAKPASARTFRLALATNLVVVVLAGVIALVLLVLALAHGV